MTHQLPADCLIKIFEYLEDQMDLCSCLLVNRLLWFQFYGKNIQNYEILITFLPNESKEILYNHKIIIQSPTSKPSLFDYIIFIKNILIHDIDWKIQKVLKNHQIITSQFFDSDETILVIQEVFKMIMSKVFLKELRFFFTSNYFSDISFVTCPGIIDWLKKNLLELSCSLDIPFKFFHQMSQICHHFQSLNIIIKYVISNKLEDLISVQQNLKSFTTFQSVPCRNFMDIIPLIL